MAFPFLLVCNFMEKLVIIGGGVAGLSCLNAFLDRGISPLLLEGSTIGSPKMCGEFLAPSIIAQLQEWGIGRIQSIKQVRFDAVTCSFPRAAGAYARHDAELGLAARAKKQGARIVEQARINNIIPATQHSPYIMSLVSGEIIEAQDVIIASGGFSKMTKSSKYVGFKTHIPQVIEPETLLMFSLAGGYLGIVPIGPEKSNLTCLIKSRAIEKVGSCKAFLHAFMPDLKPLDWLEGPAPAFGLKTIPNWPHAYWIGDAFASIHPAIGYGFGHGVSSALLAADYYLKHDPEGFHQALRQTIRPKRIMGAYMHQLLQRPRLCHLVSPLIQDRPRMLHHLLHILDY